MEFICPECGKTVLVPEELKEFSCVYCGKRIKLPEKPGPEDAEAAFLEVKDGILACVREERQLRESIRKDAFDKAFLAYEERRGELFRKLDAACQASGAARAAAMMDEVVEVLLTGLEADWEAAAKKRIASEDDKVTVAIFLVPMVRHLRLSCSEDFVQRLQKAWVERYPKNPFYIGSYEELSAGFRKKYLGLCFITTAVCRQEGKGDDCEELTAFRRFRDGYLRRCQDGPGLIREYYDIAPAIVTMIPLCADPEQAYGEIRRRWLDDCYRDLQAGRMEACKARYIDMVRTLERAYLS